MTTWFPAIFRWLVAALVAATLAACGGGKGGGDSVPVPPPTASTLDTSGVSVGKRTLSNGLVGQQAAAAVAPTAEPFFAWVKRWSEEAKNGFFPGDPTTQSETFDGVDYWTRHYTTGHLLAIRKSDSAVYVQWKDKTLFHVGFLVDYTCDVLGCGGTGKAGTLDLSAALQQLVPDFVDGGLTYLGAEDQKTYKPTPAEITKVCWTSNRRGWFDKDKPNVIPEGCASPKADGTLALEGMCSNDEGQLVLLAGRKLWPDFTAARGWKLAGDLNPKLIVLPNDKGTMIQYGKSGYIPAKVSYSPTGGKLVANFASSCLRGFSAPLVAGNIQFRWMSDRDGWFDQTNKRGYLAYDTATESYSVTIEGVSCGQRGQVTAYLPKTMEGNQVKAWQSDPAAWFAVPAADNANPFWLKGDKVDWFHQVLLHKEEHSISLGC